VARNSAYNRGVPLDSLTFAALFQEDFASQRRAHPVNHKQLTAVPAKVHAIEHEQSVPGLRLSRLLDQETESPEHDQHIVWLLRADQGADSPAGLVYAMEV
jgi:hypothetical protein